MAHDLVDIEDFFPHDAREVMCWKCGKRWIAVYRSSLWLKDLECPQCGCQGFVFSTGQPFDE